MDKRGAKAERGYPGPTRGGLLSKLFDHLLSFLAYFPGKRECSRRELKKRNDNLQRLMSKMA